MKIQTPLLSYITTCLTATSDTPALDASVLLAHIANKSRTWVTAHPELTLNPEQQDQLNDALEQLGKGKPFPFVLGHWEFFGLEFEITPDVLIPRPETELLVEKAIAWIQKNPARKNIADIGTGSGAIAVSLAVNLPHVNILATDISSEALQIARGNAKKHGIENRIEFVEYDLLPHPFAPLPPGEGLDVRKFDLLCANLPYIPTQTLRQLSIFGREPTVALDGGEDGFELIRRLMQSAPNYISPAAMLLFEIEATLGEQATQIAHQMFPNANIDLHKDLTGRDRLLEVELI